MSALNALSDEQFEQHALGILQQELGLDGLARFLRVYRASAGDYTAERDQWLTSVRLEDITRDLTGGQ